jgi:predicted DNA-binding transcriptional regulator YafY
MDKFDRILQLHAILSKRRSGIPVEDLTARLECSKPTLYRAITTLKDTLNAPIVFDKERGGIRYLNNDARYELPGLWFTPAELQALVIIQRFLNELGGGLLEEHFAPLAKRINQLTSHKRLNLSQVATRVRMPALAARPTGPAFQSVISATLQRKQLWIEYRARTSDEVSERTISPQRVIHYRESWYLDAWDEQKNALRTFAIDRIAKLRTLADRAQDIAEQTLDDHFSSGYGIFSGKADNVAVLRFSKESARWVADEQWHPQQHGKFLDDGRYELRIPYSNPRELVMDVLRHGPNVEVLDPKPLREEIKRQLIQTVAQYAD